MVDKSRISRHLACIGCNPARSALSARSTFDLDHWERRKPFVDIGDIGFEHSGRVLVRVPCDMQIWMLHVCAQGDLFDSNCYLRSNADPAAIGPGPSGPHRPTASSREKRT